MQNLLGASSRRAPLCAHAQSGCRVRVVIPHASVARGRALARRRGVAVRASDDSRLAPAKPKSSLGEMLEYYLDQQPHLFQEAVRGQLERIKAERRNETSLKSKAKESGGSELVLYQRMGEVREAERRLSVEDVMYLCVVEKFVSAGVDLLPPLDGMVDLPPGNFKFLTEGVHSKEALDLVKEHLMAVMGPASQAFGSTPVKFGKLQAAQVYAASIMFGYFIRRIDKRFQLDMALGTLDDQGVANAAARLEKLFKSTHLEDDVDEDGRPVGEGAGEGTQGARGGKGEARVDPGEQSSARTTLKGYMERFDQATLQETARLVSVEGMALVERQTIGLFGKISDLQREMQEAVGEMNEIADMQELVRKLQQAVVEDKVQTVTMTAATQRRMVLEAVAYGTFLRDVETMIDDEYALLTPLPSYGGPGLLGDGGDSPVV